MSLSRRRFLCISAAAAGVAGRTAAALPRAAWRGVALGAPASLQLVGLAPERAAPVFSAVEAELSRLENIFSLYRSESAVSKLNRKRRLPAPPAELLEVLSLSDSLHHASEGAFDPTVQPLFALNTLGRPPTDREYDEALARVGWDAVRFEAKEVVLTRPGTAMTLNGIAQGYITDRVAALLTARGLQDVLVDMGEVRALGQSSTGPWRAGVADDAGRIVERITLTDSALATSAPFSSQFGTVGHIFTPASGRTSDALSLVSVTAPTAAMADGISTALAAGGRNGLVTAFPGAKIVHLS